MMHVPGANPKRCPLREKFAPCKPQTLVFEMVEVNGPLVLSGDSMMPMSMLVFVASASDFPGQMLQAGVKTARSIASLPLACCA
jgi:hypothetical protein